MPRRRPDTHDLARRFLQLDTGIRLAAAAGGMLPMQDRPESPAQTYPYDHSLQHPKPKPAQPTIRIGQLENVARSKPQLKTRSVSDPGDAHRLIARFVKTDEKRAMTSDPPPTPPRAFPFPSMAVRRSTTLENFLEMESSANETGEDPLAHKMGQILARRAAAATRALSRSSGRRSVDSSGRRSLNSSRRSSRLRVESTADARDAKRASLAVKRESLIVDDRSPHEGAGPVWPRGFAPKAKGSSAPGAETGPRNERAVSFSASRDSLRSFVFPTMPTHPELSPVQSYFGSQPPDHFAAQPYTSPRLSIMTVPQFADDAQSFVVPASPASGVYVSPVESVAMFGSPVSVRFPASPASPVNVRTSPVVQISPSSVRIQTSPAALAQSPTRMRVQTSPTTALYQTPIAPYQPSPTARFPSSPTTRYQPSPSTRYQPSPTTIYSQPSPISPSHQRHTSDAHVNLLRGLSPLPTHGLPLPAPHGLTLRARGSSIRDSFVSMASVDLAQVPETSSVGHEVPAEHEVPTTIAGREMPVIITGREMPTSTAGREMPAGRAVPSGLEMPTSGHDMPMTPLYEMPTPIDEAPAQDTPATSSSPSPVTALATTPTPPRSNPSPLPLASHGPHTAPHDQTSFRLPDPASFPIQFPRPSYTPSPRSRPITPLRFSRARSPLGSADEVVFRGSSSSTASTPQKRKRRRARLPVRANSESVVGRRGASDPKVRRTAQSLMRRAQTGEDRGEVSSDGRDVVLFVPRSLVPPLPGTPMTGERRSPPVERKSPPVESRSPPQVENQAPSPAERPVPPPLVRRESIPLPESLPPAGPPELPELQKPIIEPPPPARALAYLPWSPPRRVLSRPDMVSREGSFVTAPDSFDEDDFPGGLPGSWDMDARFASTPVRFVGTPVHMDLSELEEESRLSMVTAAESRQSVAAEEWRQSVMTAAESRQSTVEDEQVPERATISSAMRGQVAQPVTMTRRPSGDFAPVRGETLFAPSPPRSTTPARRAAATGLSGVFQPGFLVPPSPLGPSPLASSRSSQTPHSSTRTGGNSDPNAASIPVRHDQSYSPPRFGLPRSVTPRTEASVRHPEDESFHSTHTADPMLRLPLDDWLEFAMSSMAAMGIPLTRSTLEELHESEDESVAVAEALSPSSMRRSDLEDAGVLDGVSQADDDSAGDSLSLSLSDVGSTPSPSRSEHSILFSTPPYAEMTFTTVPPEPSTGTRPTINTSNLEWATDEPGNISPVSHTSTGSESARAVDSLQNIAAAVRELNLRTPIPSSSSGSIHPPGPPSIPAATPQPPVSGFQTAPTDRSLSTGSVSITFNEASPIRPSVPPLVVLPSDRDWFADSLLRAEYRQSFQQLRDDDYRALDEGEDVVLYGVGGEWEQVNRYGAESHATTDSAVPIEYDPDSEDLAARNKYIQFLLSFAGALRTPGPNRPPRWVETALRTLRGQVHGSGPRYQSDLYDAITRAEAELDRVPPPPVVPEHLSSTFVSSSSSGTSSIGSALPEEDEILEEFIRSVITPQPATPPRPTPLLTHLSNVVPWPALPSPISPRVRILRSISRQTARSQATSITTVTTSTSAYSSIIPPLPRVRARTVEPHWLAVYLQRKWPVPDTYISRRTYSSPSALGPPMPYNWRPICHISPERLWEITNLAFRVDMPPPPPPPQAIAAPPRAIAYSERTVSSSSSGTFAMPEPVVVVDGRMTSHPNLQINESQESIPPVPPLPPVPRASETLSVTRSSRNRASLASAHRYSLGAAAASGSDRPFPTARRVVTPVAASRRRTMMNIVGRLVGKERARTHSVTSSRSPTPLIKSRFGLAGKIVDVTRRVFRNPRRRSRLMSTRSQRTVRGDA